MVLYQSPKQDCTVCPAPWHMALPAAYPQHEYTRSLKRLFSQSGVLSANLFFFFCRQQWQRGCGAHSVLLDPTVQSTWRIARGSLYVLCLSRWTTGREKREGRVIGSRPGQHSKHDCREGTTESRGGAWLSPLLQGCNSLPSKHWRKPVQ